MANASPPKSSADDFDDLSSLGKYKIQRKVGSGGMGSVYLAIDQQLKRTVALKILPKDKAANQTLVRRFKAEGQAGAQMEHPNIISVYESGEIDGFLYLAMEFVEGIDAFELLRKRGVIPVKRSVDIIKQVVLALQHANERQIVHRDIKPSNLMIRDRDGVVKLADLGLARFLEEDGDLGLTRAGTTVGTVDYMSPEQARDSKAADIRSDLYSLGCTWYHLLTGTPPYPEGDLMNKLRAHAMQPVPDPRILNDKIPASVVSIIQRMMAKKPDDRYQTPAQLLADLNLPTLLRTDLSVNALQLLGASHTDQEPDAFDESSETESQRSSARRRPVTAKPSPEVKSLPPRSRRTSDEDEGELEEDEPTPAPVRKSGAQPKAKATTSSRETLPARTTRAASAAETETGKKSKSERVLPARIDKPVAPERPRRQYNPNLFKLGLLGVLVAAAFYGGFLIVNKIGGDSSGDPAAVNPYANREKGVSLPPVRPEEQAQAPPGNSVPTPMPQAEVSTVNGKPSQTMAPNGSVDEAVGPLAGLELDRTPFGESVPFSETGTAQIPQWVWRSRGKFTTAVPRVIRRGNPKEGEFRDLELASRGLNSDVVFEFADVGPHEIPPFELKSPHNWTFRAADGVAPVLILRSAGPPISVTGGTLTLDGVHLVVLPDHPEQGIRVTGARLIARHASLTHLAPQSSGVILAGAAARVMLENTIIRGQGTCHPVTLQGEGASLVAGQSLLLGGNASAIQVESRDAKSDNRLITLVSSACLSGQSAITCTHEGKKPPQLGFNILSTILSYLPGHSADGVGVLFKGWPSAVDALDRPRVTSVKWTADKSSFVGWPHWAQLNFADGAEAVDVRDEDAWRAFWRQASPTGTLIPLGADLQLISDKGVLATGDDVQLGFAGIKTSLNETGPRWADLPGPPNAVLANVVAFGQSPTIARGLESPEPGSNVEYDLKKSALGKFINSDQCPDGSTVVAFGFGLRTIDPFVVRQKRVQIVFKQTEGAALKLQPGVTTDSGRPAAWFAVEDGQLTLTNGSFLLQATKVRSYPERFLKMSGGLVALKSCRVEGSDPSMPLLDTSSSEGHAPPQLLVDKTLLVSPGTLVRLGAAETLVEIRGSALASSSGDAVTIDAAARGAVLAVNRSTLSGTKSIFHAMSAVATSSSSLFARECVFRGGAVVQLAGEAGALQWWGVENAYSSTMTRYRIDPSTGPKQDFTRDWVNGWGAGHELLSIFGANRTVIPDPPTNLSDIVPQSFQLNATCDAALAGPGGAGVGAVISQLGPSQQVATKTEPPKKGMGNNRPNAPNF